MNRIDVKRFGLATGSTLAFLYLGCMFVMATTDTDTTILFFNSLLHGIDVRSILRTDMPLWEALMGIVEIFALGWLAGAAMAAIYNISAKK
ncbi:MAG: hypothetical protein CMP91_05925 [Gammaproteobacteria bacterium]|nr:hypothetical protein [Gammaproteobacteria bacterium]MAY02891.1 hypothetical protein [Gammaproteobacteria bacterium]|tara:strand:+ start:703 stop:975 length:273 start_codon:yes stop_codon:yes gene_type:complete